MSILIHINPARAEAGVTVRRVTLCSGTLIGSIERTSPGASTARTAEGHSLVLGDTLLTFPSLGDAEAHVWMAFMAGRPNPSYTITRSEHAG